MTAPTATSSVESNGRSVDLVVPDGPAAFNGVAAEARTEILSTLGVWSGGVARQRHLAAPARTAPALAEFLLANVGWSAVQPSIGDLTAQIARTVAAARRAAFPDPVRRITVPTRRFRQGRHSRRSSARRRRSPPARAAWQQLKPSQGRPVRTPGSIFSPFSRTPWRESSRRRTMQTDTGSGRVVFGTRAAS